MPLETTCLFLFLFFKFSIVFIGIRNLQRDVKVFSRLSLAELERAGNMWIVEGVESRLKEGCVLFPFLFCSSYKGETGVPRLSK